MHPLPIADAVAALAAADSLHERRDRVVECFRAVIRYTGAVVLSARAQFGPGPGDESIQLQDLLRGLRRRGLTDGQWVGLIRGLLRAWSEVPDTYAVPRIVELFYGHHKKKLARAIDGLLEMRKSETIAHGATGAGADLEAVLARRAPQLDELLASFGAVWDAARLVVPLSAPGDDDASQPAWLLSGYTPPRGKWPRVALAGGVRVAPGHPILIDPDGAPLVALHPIAMFRRPSPEAVEELFVLDGAKKSAARYVALPSMAEHRESEVWGHLARSLLEDDDGAEEESAVAGLERPYRGLASFGPEHAAVFFGREKQAEALANRIRRHPMITLTGPSGSGKTSLLHAGVFPLLDDMPVVTMRPGADPIGALNRELTPVAGPMTDVLANRPETLGLQLDRFFRATGKSVVIFVDQAEEIFTLCRGQKRRRAFAEALASAGLDPDGHSRVVISLREDFFARLSTLRPLRGHYSQHVEVVTTPDRDDLLRIGATPARLFGYDFEDTDLLDTMVDAIVGEPAALVMLQFCCDQMWERRDRTWKRLTHSSYKALGGVAGALASHAESTLTSLTPAQQVVAKTVFLQLVTPQETRQVVARDDLLEACGNRDEAIDVLDKLVDSRLVTSREGESASDPSMVELVHEALIEHWQRLRTWLEEDHEFLRVRARIASGASRWSDEGKPADLLLGDGKPLAEAEALVRDRIDALRPIEIDYVQASSARGRFRARLKNAAITGLGALAVIAGVFGVFAQRECGKAQRQSRIAEHMATEASQQTERAEARERALVEEQGRQRLLDGEPLIALVYLSDAYSRGSDSTALRSMMADAVRTADARRLVIDTGEGITTAAYSPDGSLVATVGYDGAGQIWDVTTAKRTTLLRDYPQGYSSLRFTPDGAALVSANVDRTIRLWDVTTGEVTRTFVGHDDRLQSLSISPDGSRMASGDWKGVLRVWDMSTGQQLFTANHARAIASVRYGPGGAWIATSSHDDTVAIWDAASGARLAVLAGHEKGVTSMTLGPGGELLATGDGVGTVRVWRAADWTLANAIEAHDMMISALAFSPDGTRLATGSWDRTAAIWDPLTGYEAARLVGHADLLTAQSESRATIDSVQFSGDGRRVLTSSVDGARVWDAHSGTTLAFLAAANDRSAARFSPDYAEILTIRKPGELVFWRVGDRLLHTLSERMDSPVGDGRNPPMMRTGAFSSDGARLLTVSLFGPASLWDAATGERTASLAVSMSAAFSPDGARVATAGDDGRLTLWDAATGEVSLAIDGTFPRLDSVSFSSDGTRVVAGAADQTARIWNAETGALVAELAGHEGPVFFATFDAGGARVATCDGAGTTRVWDARTSRLLVELRAPDDQMSMAQMAAFSPDGRRILTATSGKSVNIWDVATGGQQASLAGHSGAFNADGTAVLTIDNTTTPMLWDAASGTHIATLEGHTESVYGWAFSPDGARIATAGGDGTARIWDAATGRQLAAISASTGALNAVAFDPAGDRIITVAEDGAKLWKTPLENRGADAIAAIVRKIVPWRLQDGRLVPR